MSRSRVARVARVARVGLGIGLLASGGSVMAQPTAAEKAKQRADLGERRCLDPRGQTRQRD
jgi:hypothetical protein